MPAPEFTADEKCLINLVKSPTAVGDQGIYMWGYLVGGATLAAFGVYLANVPMMIAAFLVVCGFRIYEERYQRKWMPLWRSIIEKYERAMEP